MTDIKGVIKRLDSLTQQTEDIALDIRVLSNELRLFEHNSDV